MDQCMAVVTGAARGLGAAIAEALVSDGYKVVAVDSDGEALERTWSGAKGNVFTFVMDLKVPLEISKTWAIITQRHGPADVLVNNAAISHVKPIWDITVTEWNDVVAVNQRAVFLLSRLASKAMVERRWGRIVNIASLAGQAPRPSGAHYAATKGAVLALTRVFAAEVAADGVTVNAIAPGTIETAMTSSLPDEELDSLRRQIPVGRLGLVSEIASTVRFLASEEAAFITGATFDANGGVLMR